MFTLRLLSTEHGTGVVQVVKFTDLQSCEAARGIGNPDDGVVTVCTTSNKDVTGFIAAMGCNNSKMDKLPDGTELAKFACAPNVVVTK